MIFKFNNLVLGTSFVVLRTAFVGFSPVYPGKSSVYEIPPSFSRNNNSNFCKHAHCKRNVNMFENTCALPRQSFYLKFR